MVHLLRRGLLTFLVATAACSHSAASQMPPAPPIPEHHRNPDSRTVTINYTCADGSRTLVMTYNEVQRGLIIRLERNGRPTPRPIIAALNNILNQFDYVSSIYPQCGSRDDTFAISGMKDKVRSGLLIRWSLADVHVDQTLE